MKKQLVIIGFSILSFVSPAAFAQWEGSGLIGVSRGYNWFTGKFDFDATLRAPGVIAPMGYIHNHLGAKGWAWGVLGGYQLECNDWIVGGELNVDWQDSQNSQSYGRSFSTLGVPTGTSVFATFKHDATIALTARVGYRVLPWLVPFFRFGMDTSEEELQVAAQQINAGVTSTFAANGTSRTYRVIGGAGAEVQVPMLCALTLRAEYIYHSPSQAIDIFQEWTPPGIVSHVRERNHVNSLKASLVYNFNL